MLAEVLAFLRVVPILWDLWKSAEKAFGPDWPKKSMAVIDAYGEARNATTPEQMHEAARRIHDAWAK